jgi:predicted adenylyl cyclase CyaB
MPVNIEIKAALSDRAAAETVAVRLSDTSPETVWQEDIFFHCADARLKLRMLAGNRGELIRYERSDIADARCSQYLIAHTTDAQVLKQILTTTLGVREVVKKTRTVYIAGQTRIHIDDVEGLGTFLELEVGLQAGQSEIEGKAIAESLMAEFGIDKQQLIAAAYVDLIAECPSAGDPSLPV